MIHKFIFDGTRIVHDVHSGALHVVDELVWDLLEEFGSVPEEALVASLSEKYNEEDVQEAILEIKELVNRQILFAPDPLGGKYSPSRENVIKALCLHLAHDCNLSCVYCFAGQGKFGGLPGLMTPEAGKRALEFLVESSGSRRHLEVDFFGGEPLLNLGVLRMLVEYGRDLGRESGKQIKFTVTTNAVLLDREAGDFFNKNDISVILSIDGRREVHNAMRPFRNGSGSYEVVVKNIKDFLRSRNYQDYYVRGTYTALNTDFASDVEYLASLGIDNISMEPVVAGSQDYYSIKDGMIGVVSSEYEKLARLVCKMKKEGRHINFFHFNIDFEGGPCLPKRMSGCGAGYQYLAVDPEGSLYPCHQFVGLDQFVMGDVFKGIWRTDLVDLFRNSHLYRKDGCGRCWAKFHCSGGCHANAYIHNGSIDKPYALGCALTKKRLECAIYLAQSEYSEKA